MLEKCCHDIDFYSMITNSRPIKLASFGSRDLLFQKIYLMDLLMNILKID